MSLRCSGFTPAFPSLWFSRSGGFLPNDFGLRLEPIIEVVTVFTATILVKVICAYSN